MFTHWTILRKTSFEISIASSQIQKITISAWFKQACKLNTFFKMRSRCNTQLNAAPSNLISETLAKTLTETVAVGKHFCFLSDQADEVTIGETNGDLMRHDFLSYSCPFMSVCISLMCLSLLSSFCLVLMFIPCHCSLLVSPIHSLMYDQNIKIDSFKSTMLLLSVYSV